VAEQVQSKAGSHFTHIHRVSARDPGAIQSDEELVSRWYDENRCGEREGAGFHQDITEGRTVGPVLRAL
jgi:hypothetical protein